MKHIVLIGTIALTAIVWPGHSVAQTQQDKAGAHIKDLRFASYVTSRQVEQHATDPAVRCAVEVEEVVTRYTLANNGAGPMWCYGSTVIARQGGDVYLSVIETGEDVPLLCNTRWLLWHRSADGWKLEQAEKEYRQREPCPSAVFHGGPVFLSVNPSTEPAGTKYGACNPLVLELDPTNPTSPTKTHKPAWADGSYFTDHSYRDFMADGANGELLLLNINAKTSEQFVSYLDSKGQWHEKGTITFPIRSCYPQVALRDGEAHVMAIGDIVEPVAEWRKLKYEKLKRDWDYVFRRLFYTYTGNIRSVGFNAPIEIDTVEKTCGQIRNLDLYIDDTGAAHLLYLKQPHQFEFIRDKYFPDGEDSLEIVKVLRCLSQVPEFTVHVLSNTRSPSARFSRHCAHLHHHSSENDDEWIEAIVAIAQQKEIDAVLPVTLRGVQLISQKREVISKVSAIPPTPEYELIEQLTLLLRIL